MSDAEDFMKRDFEQCFQMMRHYDAQVVDAVKFLFSFYVAVIGGGLGLAELGVKHSLDLAPVAAAILGLGILVGVVLLAVIVETRVYFVRVTRYINEQRHHHVTPLASLPGGFANRSKMYVKSHRPHFFEAFSSQTWAMYLVAGVNAFLTTAVLMILGPGTWWGGFAPAAGLGLAAAVVQIALLVFHLKDEERRVKQEADEPSHDAAPQVT